MARTIFYSWQSDTPASITRNFIEDALKKAIKRVNKDLPEEHQLQFDKDTLNVPGNPPITDTILKKIQDCTAFCGDLTLVAKSDESKGVPNPNVMLELGYALMARGHERFLLVMNDAFGPADDLPFNLKHMKRPILYTLEEASEPQNKKAAREELTSTLEKGIRAIIEYDEEPAIGPPEQEVEPQETDVAQETPEPTSNTYSSPSFLSDGDEVIHSVPNYPGEENAIWREGPLSYLRLIQEGNTLNLTFTQTLDIVRHHLTPFGNVSGLPLWEGKNSWGAVKLAADESVQPRVAKILTQLFRSGEIWGLSTAILTLHEGIIPLPRLRSTLTRCVGEYLKCAREVLSINPPIRLEMGLVGIKGFQIGGVGDPYEPVQGSCLTDEVRHSVQLTNLTEPHEPIVSDYLNTLLDHAGLG